VVGAGQTPGETTGNGRATAVVFAREGARVFIVDRDRTSLDETARLVEDAGGHAIVHVCEIGSEDSCRGLIEAAHRALGRIDILHNNVGIVAGDAGPASLVVEVWDRILDINLKAMWLTCKHALPIMREQRSGAIVNISSLAAIGGRRTQTAYWISKAGVNALTQSLAATNARFGIRVNAIMPGLIDTPAAVDQTARWSGTPRDAVASERAAHVPLGRQGTGWDVAAAALFLVSDDSAFITGAILPVDGGQSVRAG
jgi:NAD(P)-dependent dehydrogenase (short-subunit alcohol dehydrogenase family)